MSAEPARRAWVEGEAEFKTQNSEFKIQNSHHSVTQPPSHPLPHRSPQETVGF